MKIIISRSGVRAMCLFLMQMSHATCDPVTCQVFLDSHLIQSYDAKETAFNYTFVYIIQMYNIYICKLTASPHEED